MDILCTNVREYNHCSTTIFDFFLQSGQFCTNPFRPAKLTIIEREENFKNLNCKVRSTTIYFVTRHDGKRLLFF